MLRRQTLMTRPRQRDEFLRKGALEQEAPDQIGNACMRGQLGHRTDDPLIKAADTDFPEPGENVEHSGEPVEAQDTEKAA